MIRWQGFCVFWRRCRLILPRRPGQRRFGSVIRWRCFCVFWRRVPGRCLGGSRNRVPGRFFRKRRWELRCGGLVSRWSFERREALNHRPARRFRWQVLRWRSVSRRFGRHHGGRRFLVGRWGLVFYRRWCLHARGWRYHRGRWRLALLRLPGRPLFLYLWRPGWPFFLCLRRPLFLYPGGFLFLGAPPGFYRDHRLADHWRRNIPGWRRFGLRRPGDFLSQLPEISGRCRYQWDLRLGGHFHARRGGGHFSDLSGRGRQRNLGNTHLRRRNSRGRRRHHGRRSLYLHVLGRRRKFFSRGGRWGRRCFLVSRRSLVFYRRRNSRGGRRHHGRHFKRLFPALAWFLPRLPGWLAGFRRLPDTGPQHLREPGHVPLVTYRAPQDITCLGNTLGAYAFTALKAFTYRLLLWMPFAIQFTHSPVCIQRLKARPKYAPLTLQPLLIYSTTAPIMP